MMDTESQLSGTATRGCGAVTALWAFTVSVVTLAVGLDESIRDALVGQASASSSSCGRRLFWLSACGGVLGAVSAQSLPPERNVIASMLECFLAPSHESRVCYLCINGSTLYACLCRGTGRRACEKRKSRGTGRLQKPLA